MDWSPSLPLFGGIHFSPSRPDPDNITRMDTQCLPMIHSMHQNGIRIDVPYLQSFSQELTTLKSDYESSVRSSIGSYQYFHPGRGSYEPFKLSSRDHLAQLFFEHLKIQGDDPVPLTPKRKRFEVSEEILEPFKNRHPAVSPTIEWFKADKIQNTYADPLPLLVDSNSRLHTQFNVTIAATGRLSSSCPNLQNIPTRTDIGKRIRQAFIASTGWRLLSVDLSQIEMVWAAHRSQDPTMLSVFRNGEDLHDRTTCNVFNLDYREMAKLKKLVSSGNATPDQVQFYLEFKQQKRLPCKTVGFGVLYGQTAEGLQSSLASEGVFWTLEQCQDFIDHKFFSVYPYLKVMLDEDYTFATRYAMICCDFGRARLVPEAKSVLPWIRHEGIRKAGNHPEQASAQGTIKIAMARLTPFCNAFSDSIRPLLQIHDELIFEAREDFVDDVAVIAKDEMESATPLTVPVRSSADIAERWSDLK